MAKMGKTRGTYQILFFKPLGKWLLGRQRRWKDNIKLDLREESCLDGKWMKLPKDCVRWQALVLVVLNICVQQCVESLDSAMRYS
jgi:hypothetical protein